MTGLAFWRNRLNGEPGDVAEPAELIEPTPEEASNGWDAASLTAYVNERRQAETETALLPMFDKKRHRPRWANGKYHPHFWRAARAR